LYKFCLNIVTSTLFKFFIALCIASNTLILSLDKYPENIKVTMVTEKLNIFFTIIFSIELTL